MPPIKNKKFFASAIITGIITVLVLFFWIFGQKIFSTIFSFVTPASTPVSVWKILFIVLIAATFGYVAENHPFKRVFPATIIFCALCFMAGVVSNGLFETDLAVLPVIAVALLTVIFIHLKKIWQIDRDLTERLVSLASTGHILEGKPADLRIESGFRLLETIFPVSEIIYFRYEPNGNLNPVGRARKDKKNTSLSSRQDSWKRCIALCEEALATRKTRIQKDGTHQDAAQIALPLIINKVIIGILFVDVKQNFEREDQNLLESFSQQLARTFKRQEIRHQELPYHTWWNSFSTQSLENRLDITSLVQEIIKEQSFSAIAGSYLKEAHAISYLDGTLVYINRRMKSLANLDYEDIRDLDLFTLLGKFRTDIFSEPSLAIRRVMQTGDSFECELNFPEEFKTLSMEISLVKIPVENNAIHETNVQKVPACFLITFRNVSALKENEKLRSDMAHLMSHELRTPITSIQGFAEILLLEDNIPAESREYLRTIAAESQRAGNILTNFLSVSNLQQSDKQEVIKTPVEVNNVVHNVVENYSRTAKKKRIRIVEKQSPAIAPIAADRGLLTKAISHLLDNAIRYSPERTSVMISTFLETDFLRVEVEDRGYGIPVGEQEKIWQKFYRVARDGHEKDEDTTGLGLSLVKEIIEQHNGEVIVQSVEGRGSKFSFRLPRL
jgi:signal transduction histidine kinase